MAPDTFPSSTMLLEFDLKFQNKDVEIVFFNDSPYKPSSSGPTSKNLRSKLHHSKNSARPLRLQRLKLHCWSRVMRHSTGKWAKLPWPPAIEDVLLSCWRFPYLKAAHKDLLLLHSSSFIKLAGRESHPEFHTAKSFPDRWFLKPFHFFRIVLTLTSLQDTPRQDRDANEHHMRTGDARRISKAVIDGVFDEKLH